LYAIIAFIIFFHASFHFIFHSLLLFFDFDAIIQIIIFHFIIDASFRTPLLSLHFISIYAAPAPGAGAASARLPLMLRHMKRARRAGAMPMTAPF